MQELELGTEPCHSDTGCRLAKQPCYNLAKHLPLLLSRDGLIWQVQDPWIVLQIAGNGGQGIHRTIVLNGRRTDRSALPGVNQTEAREVWRQREQDAGRWKELLGGEEAGSDGLGNCSLVGKGEGRQEMGSRELGHRPHQAACHGEIHDFIVKATGTHWRVSGD